MLFFKDVYSSSCNLDYTPWRKDVSYVSSIAWVLCISGCLIISSEINNSLSLWGVTEDPGVALGMLPQPSVTCIVRKSCTQSPTSAKESLMLRSASLTSGRRQNWASSHSVATWCQMNMSSSPLKPWRLPVFVPTSTWWKAVAKMAFTSNCDFTLPCHLHQQDVVLCWGWQAPDKYLTFLWKALGHGGQGPQVIMSIRTTLQNTQHVIEALCRAKFKFPGHQKPHVSKKWAFTNVMWTSLKTWWLKSSSSWMAVESNTSLIVVPGTKGRPGTHESLRATPFLSLPTNPTSCPKKERNEKAIF